MIFLIGLFLGLFIGYIFRAEKPNESPKFGFNLKIQIDRKRLLHIHHYMYILPIAFYTALISYILTGKLENKIILSIISFCIGLSLNNVLYDDMFEFIKYNDICERFKAVLI